MNNTKRKKLTVTDRAGLVYKALLEIQNTYVYSHNEAKRLEERFTMEVECQIKNHARDLINELIAHYEGHRLTFIPRKELIKLLQTVQKHTGAEPAGDYCPNCDRLLSEHTAQMFGDVRVSVCYGMPEREMILVGPETARLIAERMQLKSLAPEEKEIEKTKEEEGNNG